MVLLGIFFFLHCEPHKVVVWEAGKELDLNIVGHEPQSTAN